MKSDWYASQGTSLPASIESGVSLRNSLVPNSTTLYTIKLSECYGVFATVITRKVTLALPLHLFSLSHSPLCLSCFGHKVQTLQTPFIATQLPTSLSSRCNKLPPFSGSYIYLAFPVQLTSPKTPIPAVARPTHHLQDYILY